MPVREKINKLAKGIINSSTPLISVEPNGLVFELSSGETGRQDIELNGLDGGYVKGLAYSSDSRVSVINPTFGGYSVKISIQASVKSSENDNRIECYITLVTNGGEFNLPITINRKSVNSDDILSNLQSIEDIARIAKQDKETAVKIFEYRNFKDAPCMQDIRIRSLYDAFYPGSNKEIALEQFLISCGISQPVFDSSSNEYKDDDNQTVRVSIKNDGSSEYSYDLVRERKHYLKQAYFNYSRLRLAYEMERGNRQELISQMDAELNKLQNVQETAEYVCLLKSELMYLAGDEKKARSLLEEVSYIVSENRQEMMKEYFLLEYIKLLLDKDTNKERSFIRLCHKFIEEEKMHYLFIYILNLDKEMTEDDGKLHDFLTDVYNYGSRSPMLYYHYSMLLNDHPEYLYSPKGIDNQALNFARKYHVLSDSISEAVISASCSAFIKADRRSVNVHKTYSDGIDLGLNLIGLYEYYMYSMPQDDNYVISDNVLNHYKDDDSLDLNSKIRLYANIVKFKNHNSGIYRSYENRIFNLAVSSLKEGKINTYLADIYKGVLKPSSLDNEAAARLIDICFTYEIKTDNSFIRNILVVYPQFKTPESFQCKNGNAAININDSSATLVFQDVYGNRYYDIDHTRKRLIESDVLTSYAVRMASDNKYILARRSAELIEKKTLNGEDVAFLESAIYRLDLSDRFKDKIINCLIRYYNQHTASGYNPEFILKIDKNNLTKEERIDLCNAYISCNCYEEAYELISQFGYDGISDKNIKILCSKLIENGKEEADNILTGLCLHVFNKGIYDKPILEYLSGNYNGKTVIMYRILEKCIENRALTYDLEERLLAQVIFINDFEHIDQVFEWYVTRKNVSESILKAYFTLKSVDYFINNVNVDDKVFLYLEKLIEALDDSKEIPAIYMLALTKFYSTKEKLDKVRKEATEYYIRHLTDSGLVFPYFKSFSKYFTLPARLQDSVILVYKSKSMSVPVLKSKIGPKETDYHQDAFTNNYLGLYIKEQILFKDEEWEYIISDGTDDDSFEVRGSLKVDDSTGYNDRYSCINLICQAASDNNDIKVTEEIIEYLKNTQINRTLFKID